MSWSVFGCVVGLLALMFLLVVSWRVFRARRPGASVASDRDRASAIQVDAAGAENGADIWVGDDHPLRIPPPPTGPYVPDETSQPLADPESFNADVFFWRLMKRWPEGCGNTLACSLETRRYFGKFQPPHSFSPEALYAAGVSYVRSPEFAERVLSASRKEFEVVESASDDAMGASLQLWVVTAVRIFYPKFEKPYDSGYFGYTALHNCRLKPPESKP